MPLDDALPTIPNYAPAPTGGMDEAQKLQEGQQQLQQSAQLFPLKLQEAKLQLQAQGYMLQRRQAIQGVLSGVAANPTSANLLKAASLIPEYAEHLNKTAMAMKENEKAGYLSQIVPAFTAAGNGDMAGAAKFLAKVREGQLNAGMKDQAAGTQATINGLLAGGMSKDQALVHIAGMGVTAAGKDDWDQIVQSTMLGSKQNQARAQAEMAQHENDIKKADADYADVKAWAEAEDARKKALASGDPALIARANEAEARAREAVANAKAPLAGQFAQAELDQAKALPAKTLADAAMGRAGAAKDIQATEQAKNMAPLLEEAQKDINAEHVATTNEIKQKIGAVPEKMQDMIGTNTTAANKALAQANQFGRLAGRIDREMTGVTSSGAPAYFAKAWRDLTGNQNGIDDIRNQFNQMKTSSMLNNMVSSTAINRPNETLLELLKSEFPSELSNPRLLAVAVRRAQTGKNLEAALLNVQNGWLVNNGYQGLGKARQDFDIGKYHVKAGDNLMDIQQRIVNEYFPPKTETPATAPDHVQNAFDILNHPEAKKNIPAAKLEQLQKLANAAKGKNG